jgi:hypothetical protein
MRQTLRRIGVESTPRSMRGFFYAGLTVYLLGLAACGGGDGNPPSPVPVTLSWDANRESAVNRAGGGYEVLISRHPPRDVPFTSGILAPTSISMELVPGTYTVTVRAYAALDPQGGTTRTFSGPSPAFTLTVP